MQPELKNIVPSGTKKNTNKETFFDNSNMHIQNKKSRTSKCITPNVSILFDKNIN